MLFFKKLQEIQNFMQQYIFSKVIYEYFISIFSILNLCLLKHIINIQYPSEVISGLSHPQNKIFAKDSNIQRNRKFGYGRECFAPPSPYLWGCSKLKYGAKHSPKYFKKSGPTGKSGGPTSLWSYNIVFFNFGKLYNITFK